jgi:hypothetical protein
MFLAEVEVLDHRELMPTHIKLVMVAQGLFLLLQELQFNMLVAEVLEAILIGWQTLVAMEVGVEAVMVEIQILFLDKLVLLTQGAVEVVDHT